MHLIAGFLLSIICEDDCDLESESFHRCIASELLAKIGFTFSFKYSELINSLIKSLTEVLTEALERPVIPIGLINGILYSIARMPTRVFDLKINQNTIIKLLSFDGMKVSLSVICLSVTEF